MKEATEKEYFAADRQLLDIAKQAIKRASTLKGCNVIEPQAKNRTCQLYVGGVWEVSWYYLLPVLPIFTKHLCDRIRSS